MKGSGSQFEGVSAFADGFPEMLVSAVREFARDGVAVTLANDRRRERLESLPGRLEFVERGYDYQDSELAQARSKLREKAQAGDPGPKPSSPRSRSGKRPSPPAARLPWPSCGANPN